MQFYCFAHFTSLITMSSQEGKKGKREKSYQGKELPINISFSKF
jgi:hypothetical protein